MCPPTYLPCICSVLTPTFIVVGHNLASFLALDIVQPMRTVYYTQGIRPKSNVITDNSGLTLPSISIPTKQLKSSFRNWQVFLVSLHWRSQKMSDLFMDRGYLKTIGTEMKKQTMQVTFAQDLHYHMTPSLHKEPKLEQTQITIK